MAFEKFTQGTKSHEDASIEELERKFAKLSLKVENEQPSFKAISVHTVPENPFLNRRATAQELIEGINKLEKLCHRVQIKLESRSADITKPYIEAEDRMEKSKFVRVLSFVLHRF
ncbi:hypothetical protein PG997_002157 [Apiospora hydei]|uniref:Uncharacterized protein n=1 Tax=Apiospora hydei TaxID=1337664 RepID=A0ABR1X8K3_9PEZI